MRGPSSIWYRIRINLQHVPEDQRPPQEPLLADYNPWEKLFRTAVDAPPLSDLLTDPKSVLNKVLAVTPRCLRSTP